MLPAKFFDDSGQMLRGFFSQTQSFDNILLSIWKYGVSLRKLAKKLCSTQKLVRTEFVKFTRHFLGFGLIRQITSNPTKQIDLVIYQFVTMFLDKLAKRFAKVFFIVDAQALAPIDIVSNIPKQFSGSRAHVVTNSRPTERVNNVRLFFKRFGELLDGLWFVEGFDRVVQKLNIVQTISSVVFAKLNQISFHGFLIGRGLLHVQMVTSTLGNVNV